MKEARLALVVVAAALLLVPAAQARKSDACCIGVNVTASYDAKAKKLTATWGAPSGSRLCALYVFAGYTRLPDGSVDTKQPDGVEGFIGCNDKFGPAAAGTWTSSSDNVNRLPAFERDFYVQIVFNCTREFPNDPPPTAAQCGSDKVGDWFQTIRSNAVKVPVQAAAPKPKLVPIGFSVKRGAATMTSPGGKAEPVGPGTQAVAGSLIRTGKGTVLELTFPGGSKGILGPATAITLTVDGAIVRIGQKAGEALYVIKKAFGPRFRAECGNCNAVAAVRGTTFAYRVKGRQARAQVYDGTVELSSGNQRVLVKKGFEAVAGGGKVSAPKKFTPPASPFWEE